MQQLGKPDGIVLTTLSEHNGAEQSLEDKETCCLSSIFLPNVESKEEFLDIVELSYKMNKHSLLLKSHHKDTEKIVHKNMRMGINVTGVLQASEEQYSWLSEGYEYIRDFDKKYSEVNKLPSSIKLTTIQPSGCNVGNTLIPTSEGLFYLSELGDVKGDKWQELDTGIVQELDVKLATKFYVNGEKETIKIKTDGGVDLECTVDHKYRVLTGDTKYVWKEAKDLKLGDILPYHLNSCVATDYINLEATRDIGPRSAHLNQPLVLDEDLAYFLGVYYADGSTHTKGIRIAGNVTTKLENLKYLLELIQEKFEYTANLNYREGTLNADLYFTSKTLLKWLDLNGLTKLSFSDIIIPIQIRQSPKSVILSFIQGFFSGDGHDHKGLMSFTTTSKQFSQELVILLRYIGIDAKVTDMPPTKSSWGTKMRYQVHQRKGRNANSRYVKTEMRDAWNVLDELGFTDASIDKIVSLTPSKALTYDIEVPENNCYIANSYVSHNTLSLLPGVTSGVHPAYAQYLYRRIRIASNHPLVELCRKSGYPVEYAKNFDGTEEYNTVVVTFPFKYPEGTKLAKDMTAIDQLNEVRKLQSVWSDNAVSCTVYYKKEELPEIKEYLEKYYKDNHKSLSFLLHSEHGFQQAPLEEITKEQYEELVSKVTPITYLNMQLELDEDNPECSSGVCPVR